MKTAQMSPPTQLTKKGSKEWNQVPCTSDSAPVRNLMITTDPLLKKRKKNAHMLTLTKRKFTCKWVALRNPLKLGSAQGSQWKPSSLNRARLCLHCNHPTLFVGQCRLLSHPDDSTFKRVKGYCSCKAVYASACEPGVRGSSWGNLQPCTIWTISDSTRLGRSRSYLMLTVSAQNGFCLQRP